MRRERVPARPGAPCLVDRVWSLLGQLYGPPPAMDPASYLIGDAGLLALYRDQRAAGRDLTRPGEPMLLVRSLRDGHRACVYLPDRLVHDLETNDPARGVFEGNLLDFAAFVEELDHLHLLARAAEAGRPVRGVELELHANVTKMLVVGLFVARTLGLPRLDAARQRVLRAHLLARGDYEGEEEWLAVRYRDARRYGVRFLRRLRAQPVAERPHLLRRFSRAPLPQKLELCAA